MKLSFVLFLIGVLGFVLNIKNIILTLICIEIILQAITFIMFISSLIFNDKLKQTYAIGLDILVGFYRLRGSATIEFK